MSSTFYSLSLPEATELFFGTQEVSQCFVEFYNSLDMGYRKLTPQEKEKLIEEIKYKISIDSKKVTNPEREQVWFDGWRENLETFKQIKNKEAITPKF